MATPKRGLPSKRIRAIEDDETIKKTPKISSLFPPTNKSKSLSLSSPPLTKKETQNGEEETIKNKQEIAAAKLWSNKLGGEVGVSWMKVLLNEFRKPYFTALMAFITKERTSYTIYPPACDVFSWTLACELEDIKVVIIGQDPYHGPSQAHGLCFSVCLGVPPPPSLVNIYKELNSEGFVTPKHGYLIGWARQGVLLLNACLTVREKSPKSHSGKGWEKLTDSVVHWINDNLVGVVFMLWGGDAHKKGSFINQKRHLVLKSTHPSPLSAHRGFMTCSHFTKANDYLKTHDKNVIDWSNLPDK